MTLSAARVALLPDQRHEAAFDRVHDRGALGAPDRDLEPLAAPVARRYEIVKVKPK